jgi:thiol-disulfide isomerase/thioredoxin
MRPSRKHKATTPSLPATGRPPLRLSSRSTLILVTGMLILSGIFATALITATESGNRTNHALMTEPLATAAPAPLPSFEFTTLEGSRRAVEHWKGDLIVLNFWATWCPPCIREMPLFQRYHDQFSEQGLSIVTIAIDHPEAVREFVSQLGLEFAVLLGLEGGMDVAGDYGNAVGALPFTVVIDRDSQVRERRLGEVHAADLDTWIQRYL